MRIKRLERKVERARYELAHPTHPVFLPLRLGLHLHRSFRIGWRRLVKKGQTKGVLMMRFGWVSASVDY